MLRKKATLTVVSPQKKAGRRSTRPTSSTACNAYETSPWRRFWTAPWVGALKRRADEDPSDYCLDDLAAADYVRLLKAEQEGLISTTITYGGPEAIAARVLGGVSGGAVPGAGGSPAVVPSAAGAAAPLKRKKIGRLPCKRSRRRRPSAQELCGCLHG